MKQEREGKMKNKKNYQQRNKRGKVKKQSEIAHGLRNSPWFYLQYLNYKRVL